MKQLLTIAVATSMIVALAGVAQADYGMPSQETLQAMGLSGIQVMSDREAMDVRGFGYRSSRKHKKSVAIAFGISYAAVHGKHAKAHDKKKAFAKSDEEAFVATGSIAGIVHVKKRKKGKRGDQPMPWGDMKRGPKKGNNSGGGYNGGGRKGDGHKGGGYNGGGHKGGGKKIKATIVFAGGFAYSSVD